MPFGLRNSASTFIRMLQKVLYPVRECAGSYVDDIGVYSDTWVNHLKHVELTLQRVKESGLTLNIKKSEFAKPEVHFGGSIVGSGNPTISCVSCELQRI